MNLKDEPVADLPYDAVPGAQLTDAKTFFGLHLYLVRRFCKNLESALGPVQCISSPVNNMVSKRNHLLHHFQ